MLFRVVCCRTCCVTGYRGLSADEAQRRSVQFSDNVEVKMVEEAFSYYQEIDEVSGLCSGQ